MITALFGIVGVLVLLCVGCMAYKAIQRRRHRLEAPGIEERLYVEIGGIRQYLHIRGSDLKNPLLLVLHGGPGMPLSGLMHGFQFGWEGKYTVVQWDQRQSGKTYYANKKQGGSAAWGFDRAVEDAAEVTDYLRRRFGKERIAILGHSWGSVLGSALVQRYPERFLAYIGVGQVTDIQENERVGFEQTLSAAKRAHNQKDVDRLMVLRPYPEKAYSHELTHKMYVLRSLQQKYGLAEVMTPKNVLLALASPYYSLRELCYYCKDTLVLHEELTRYLFEECDVSSFGLEYRVPVYYIMGARDCQTPLPLAQELFERIHAPKKAFFTVENAGHFTMMDNKKEFENVLLNKIIL